MLAPKPYISFDYNTGETVRLDDITGNYNDQNTGGYGIPNPHIYDVNKVRFMFSSFLTVRDASQSVTECLTNVEYEVYRLGPVNIGPSPRVTVDTKIYLAGDKFVLMSDQTPVINSVLALRETGRYACVSPFLPADYYTTFAPSAFGIDNLYFPDSAYTATEEVYTTSYLANVSFPAGTYIVKGDPLNRITVDDSGISYYAGETFTTTGSTFFEDVTGTNEVCLYVAEGTITFPLCYNAQKTKDEILASYTTQGCPCREQLQHPLFQIDSRLQAIQYNYRDELNNSDSYTQTLLDEIASIGARTERC